MNISELKAGASNVTVEATVVEKSEPREVVTKYGKRLQVANIKLKDDTGSIAMSLWGNDIDSVNVGDKIRVSNGFITEFRGNPQLSSGKFGKIEVIGKGDVEADSAESSDESYEEQGSDAEY